MREIFGGKKGKRIIFVDSENLFGTEREIGKELEERELFKLLAKGKETQIFYYFTPREIKREDKGDPFLGYLDYVFNELRPQLERAGIPFKEFLAIRAGVDSMIIFGIAELLIRQKEDIEEITLLSGDGVYAGILGLAIEKGIRVQVVAGKTNCSRKLRNVTDNIIYIEDLVNEHPELISKVNNKSP